MKRRDMFRFSKTGSYGNFGNSKTGSYGNFGNYGSYRIFLSNKAFGSITYRIFEISVISFSGSLNTAGPTWLSYL